ncbi:MAG: glycosyltransferase, partial [Gammaproteobacteria bacterium]
VIPAFRAETTIARTIQSVLEQQDVDLEVIVVVDGVVDNTIREAGRFPEITVLVNESNKGAPYSRNRGLQVAKGEFVMFLDADDYIEGNLLSGLVNALKVGAADVAFGPWTIESLTDGRQSINIPSFSSTNKLIGGWLMGIYIPSCSVVWRTSSIREFGGWNEKIKINQDGEMVIRALTKNAKVAISTEGLGIYWQHDSPFRITSSSPDVVVRSQLRIGRLVENWMNGLKTPNAGIKDSLATFYYMNARGAYRHGKVGLGDYCLKKARRLGFKGHGKISLHSMASSIFGLRRKEQLSKVRMQIEKNFLIANRGKE